MAPRPVYKTFVVERHVPVPRARVWQALVELVGAEDEKHFRIDAWDLVERTLSFEPPWRRVYEIVQGAPVARYQGTTALRDDGSECHLIWSYLAEPHADGTSDAFLERAKQALNTAADLVAARATEQETVPDHLQ
jgi:hypothetical protein